jgi:hypothetical protein
MTYCRNPWSLLCREVLDQLHAGDGMRWIDLDRGGLRLVAASLPPAQLNGRRT